MEDKRREVLYQLSVMLEYANLTPKGKETVQSAIDILEKDEDMKAERIFAGKVSVLFQRLYDELDKWKTINRKQPEEAEDKEPVFQARILTDDELRMVEKPLTLWKEEKGTKEAIWQQLTEIEDELVDTEGNQVKLLKFTDGFDLMRLNGKSFRCWNRKPTAEEMRAEPWPEA